MKNRFYIWFLIIFLINFSTCFSLLTSNVVFASSQVKLDFYTWGGIGTDIGTEIALDSSEDAYVTGRTKSFGVGGFDLCLVKFNTTNGVEWNSTWGGIYDEFGEDIALDLSGNAYITGYTYSFGEGDSDMCLLKFNTTGGVEWNATWGGINNDNGKGIALDSLGNAYVTGQTSSFGAGDSDMCLLKFNTTGGIEWNSTWGGIYEESGEDIALDSSGNAYVTGYISSFGLGGRDVCLVKFNSTGGVVWNSTWGDDSIDKGSSITLDSLGNIYISGITTVIENGASKGQFALLAKFNSTGDIEWIQKWRGSAFTNYGEDLIMDSSGDFFVVVSSCMHAETTCEYDIYLVKFNSTGDVIWYCRWGDINHEIGGGLIKNSLGYIYISGVRYSPETHNPDVLLVRFIPGQCPVPEQQISGYELILVLSITFIISTFLIRKINRIRTSSTRSVRHVA